MIPTTKEHLLITAALPIELQATQKRLASLSATLDIELQFLITGVGLVKVHQHLNQFLDRHPVNLILNIGTAGTINPTLHPFDIILPIEFYTQEEEQVHRITLISDPDLYTFCAHQGWHLGKIFSSPLPVESTAQKKHIASQSAGDIVDMEAFAFQAIAQKRRIPCYSLKIITDHAEENAESEFQANLPEALDRLGQAAANFLNYLFHRGL